MNDKFMRVVREMVFASGLDFLDLAIALNASEEAVRRWAKMTQKISGEHLFNLMLLLGDKKVAEAQKKVC